MKSKSVLLIAGVVLVATATALISRALMRPPPPVTIVKEVAVAAPVVFRVLSLQRDMQPGEFIEGGSLVWQELPEKDLHASHFSVRSDGDAPAVERSLYGATPRHALVAGALLTRDAVVRAGEPGFVSAVLSPGMRAVSIPTSAVASNAGLVSAGDWVDVILSLERGALPSSEGSNPMASLAAQTILRNVRVLALNNNVESIAPVAARSEGERDDKKAARAPSRPVYETLTLEVRPEAAERLAVAREVGTLQVALRGSRGSDESAIAAADDGVERLAAARDRTARRVTRLGDATEIFAATGTGKAPAVTVKTYLGEKQAAINF